MRGGRAEKYCAAITASAAMRISAPITQPYRSRHVSKNISIFPQPFVENTEVMTPRIKAWREYDPPKSCRLFGQDHAIK
jgi:hypothetical protein